jgi:hypothetical protein
MEFLTNEELKMAVLLSIFLFPFFLVVQQLLKVGAEDERMEAAKKKKAADKEE